MSLHTEASGRRYVIVDKVDWCLSIIAKNRLKDMSKWPQLAAINGLKNPNLIHTGQKIYLDEATSGGSGGGSSSTTSTTKSNIIKLAEKGLKTNEEDTLFVTWVWPREADTESYHVVWTYSTEQGVEWKGHDEKISIDHDKGVLPLSCQSTYKIPSGAKIVWFKVKPIAIVDKKKDSNGNEVETPRFTGVNWSEKWKYVVNDKAPEVSGSINTTLTGLSLKVELTDVDLESEVTKVQFQLIRNNTSKVGEQTVSIDTNYNYASHTWTVTNDGVYKVRYRLIKGTLYSDWSDYSNEVTTAPIAPAEIEKLEALSETSVYIKWKAVTTATSYEVAYTTTVTDFDRDPDNVNTKSVTSTHTDIKDLESGKEHFFRVRAINDGGESEWTEIKSVVIGTVPEAPTIWSSASTVVVGEPLTLYWSHNCEDGSKWKYAQIRLFVNGVQSSDDISVQNTSTDEDEDVIGSYPVDTTTYSEGTTIDWQVRTRGIVNEYGEWSTPRTIDIYAQPSLELSVTNSDGDMVDTLTSFPFYVKGLAGPKTQAPLSFHVSVVANETYETTDHVGNEKIVRNGDEVYSRHFDTTENPLMIQLSASNIDLDNNVSYTVICTAAMNSGLTVEARKDFTVSWVEVGHLPNAAIGINKETWTAQINPYCDSRTSAYHKVSYANGVYTVLDTTVSGVSDDIWMLDEETGQFYIDESANTSHVGVTTTGEKVYEGVFPDGTKGYYCLVETVTMIEGVTLSVYRREFDGSFTEIAKDVANTRNTFITDPHPSLDFARYRIVATTTSTGAVAYTDVPGEPVDCKSIIIQWDEEWSSFNADRDDALAQPPYSGSMLMLPYNIDVSDSNTPEVELVKYIGRSNPTAYYGTQIGQTSTWNTTIPKTDKETLYALRRLAIWMGNCYVREPSGSGYWANVKVTFNQKHKDLTIPVTFNITRIDVGDSSKIRPISTQGYDYSSSIVTKEIVNDVLEALPTWNGGDF